MRAGLGGFVYELDAFGFESGKFTGDVVGLDSKMMNTFAAFGDELRDRRIVAGRFGKFDDSITNLKGCNANALILDNLMMHITSPKQLTEQLFRNRQVFNSNTNMRYLLQIVNCTLIIPNCKVVSAGLEPATFSLGN